jgi:hypothetical protein
MLLLIPLRDDRLAARAGSTQRKFLDMYESEITNMQRRFTDYIKSIQEKDQAGAGPPIKPVDRPDLAIAREDGLPVMPPKAVGIQQTKNDLESLIRRYLGEHYRK